MKYTLNDRKIRALYALLAQINLVTLADTGEIHAHGGISPHEGRTIYEIFYDDNFYDED